MASKIRVKGEADRITKVAACCLIRRMLACWVVRNQEIERIQPEALPPAHQLRHRLHRTAPYIPAKLPPAELPGLRFKLKELTQTLFPNKVFKSLPCIQEP